MSLHFKPLFRLIVPLLLLLAAIISLNYLSEIPSDYVKLLKLLPYGLFVIVIGLSHYFNRSRFFSAALLMAVAFWLIQNRLQTNLEEALPFYLFTTVSILLPFGLALLAVIPEKGLWNRHGIVPILVGPLLLTAACIFVSTGGNSQLHAIFQLMPLRPYPGLITSLYASAWVGITILVSLCYLLIRNAEAESSFTICIVLSFITLAKFDQLLISTIMFSAAGLTMILSLLKSSFEMAYRDELTGLLGRRALNEKLRGLGSRYVVAMIDIDHFKKFNDTHGHDVGDDVLKIVANHIAETTGGGTPYRYGGEEFCVIFPGKSLKPCAPHLEAVREAIGDHRITLRDRKTRPKNAQAGAKNRNQKPDKKRRKKTVSVTISIGIAERTDLIDKPDQVMKAADKALYRAKQNGRNCLVQ
ncbi:GGDEF domain-containing protein [Pseudomonadales bacterium]|nr:GGDEF domain-containing protein [Pseudomonadales bacterium]